MHAIECAVAAQYRRRHISTVQAHEYVLIIRYHHGWSYVQCMDLSASSPSRSTMSLTFSAAPTHFCLQSLCLSRSMHVHVCSSTTCLPPVIALVQVHQLLLCYCSLYIARHLLLRSISCTHVHVHVCTLPPHSDPACYCEWFPRFWQYCSIILSSPPSNIDGFIIFSTSSGIISFIISVPRLSAAATASPAVVSPTAVSHTVISPAIISCFIISTTAWSLAIILYCSIFCCSISCYHLLLSSPAIM